MLNLFHTRFGPIAGCEKCELDTRCTELETGWLARKFSKTGEFCWRKKTSQLHNRSIKLKIPLTCQYFEYDSSWRNTMNSEQTRHC